MIARTRRRPVTTRPLLAALALLSLIGMPSAVVAADDLTPPTGTFVIGDGSGYASSLTVTLHTEATDDVGVESMQVYQYGTLAYEGPYEPSLPWTFLTAQLWEMRVRWLDAAGNSSVQSASVQIDTSAPSTPQVQFPTDDPSDGVIPVQLSSWDSESPLTHARFRTGSGAWGAPIPVPADSGSNPTVDWNLFDTAAGGSGRLGARTVSAQVRNAAGLWSDAESEPYFVSLDSVITVSGDLRTGHAVTLTPSRPAGTTFPSNATCWWELYWGDDDALYDRNLNETWGGVTISGSPSDGFCDPWTVTLPWVPYRQFLVSFRAEVEGEPIIDAILGGEPGDPTAVRPGVDSTSRHFKTSSLPLVYVLPDAYELIVGVPVTYRAYAIAGGRITSTDAWVWAHESVPDDGHVKVGGTSLTFTPRYTGSISVCWGTSGDRKYSFSACYDPKSRRADRTDPNTSAPVQRLTGGTSSTTAPVRVTWKGSDVGWGIASYKLQRSVNGGAWKTVTLSRPKATEIIQQLAYGTSYRYRVRATDKAGNVGSWDYGPTFKPRRANETSTSVGFKSGAWSSVVDGTAHSGSLRESGTAGAWARYTFRGRDIAWIAERGPGHGKARVYIDGDLVKTIDLVATADQPRRIVFATHWSSIGEHTIKIVVSGTSGRPLVSVDGFAVLR